MDALLEYEKSRKSDIHFSRIKILELGNNELYHRLRQLIISFAALGHVDTASRLLSKLNQHDRSHGQHVGLRPLWFLWDAIDAWPSGEKQRFYDLVKEEHQKERKTNTKDERPTRKSARIENKKEDITDEDLSMKLDELAIGYSKLWWYPSKREGEASPFTTPLSTQDKRAIVREVVDAFEAMEPKAFKNAHTGAVAIDASSGLVSALDLAPVSYTHLTLPTKRIV